MKRHSISDLKDVVAWKKSRHQDASHWEGRLQEAIVTKLKNEVAQQRRKERAEKAAGASQ